MDRDLGKFDTTGNLFWKISGGKNKENILEKLTINEGASSTKVYSRAHSFPLSTLGPQPVLSDITNNSELNTGRWKRISRSDMGPDITMEDAMGEKRSGTDEDQLELLKRRKTVSQVDEATKRILVEASSQPLQDQ